MIDRAAGGVTPHACLLATQLRVSEAKHVNYKPPLALSVPLLSWAWLLATCWPCLPPPRTQVAVRALGTAGERALHWQEGLHKGCAQQQRLLVLAGNRFLTAHSWRLCQGSRTLLAQAPVNAVEENSTEVRDCMCLFAMTRPPSPSQFFPADASVLALPQVPLHTALAHCPY